MENLASGHDETLRALYEHADEMNAELMLVGAVAVILNGYERTTVDRDLLVSYRHVRPLAERLMDDADWERLEIREYAFRHLNTGIQIDFLVSRDLIKLGHPYYFPEPNELESDAQIERIPVVGLHDLIFLKLIAGRMQDLADITELCKRKLESVDADKVLARLDPYDEEHREVLADILRRVPKELEDEKRLGQQDHD